DQTDQVEMQETEIGPLPAHWQVVRLGEVYPPTSQLRKEEQHYYPSKVSTELLRPYRLHGLWLVAPPTPTPFRPHCVV
ncbi:MAG: hypothetical protein SNJ78_10095, partial [Spirochaetales bacterium]